MYLQCHQKVVRCWIVGVHVCPRSPAGGCGDGCWVQMCAFKTTRLGQMFGNNVMVMLPPRTSRQ